MNRNSALPHHPKRLCVVVPARIVTVEPAGAYRAANLSTVIRDALSTSTASDSQFLDQDIQSHCAVRRKACRESLADTVLDWHSSCSGGNSRL